MKIINSIALILSTGMIYSVVTLINKVNIAIWDGWYSHTDDGYKDYGGVYLEMGPSANELTVTAGYIMLVFLLIHLAMYFLNIKSIKTTTTNIISKIGIAVALLFILLCLGMIFNPSEYFFNKKGILFLIYTTISIVFFIVLLIQTIKTKPPTSRD